MWRQLEVLLAAGWTLGAEFCANTLTFEVLLYDSDDTHRAECNSESLTTAVATALQEARES